MLPTLTELQNTVAWMVLLVLVAAALGGVWWFAGWLTARHGIEDEDEPVLTVPMPEDWREWAKDERTREHAARGR